MAIISTKAIVISAIKYSDSSLIARIIYREAGLTLIYDKRGFKI